MMKYLLLLLCISCYASLPPSGHAPKSLHMEAKEDDYPGRPAKEQYVDIPGRVTPSTEDSEDTIPRRHHNRRMAYSNGVTAILTACITGGITLAIHFSECKK